MIKTIVDLRGKFGTARDQDPRPTCLAFAASDAHASLRAAWADLSAEWACYHAVKRDGGLPQDGSTLDSMLAVIKSDGQPIEAEWPYIRSPVIDVVTWRPPATPSELFFRDHSNCRAGLQQVVDQLDAGFPVLITMTLSNAFYLPDADGIVGGNERMDPTRRHAVVAAGYAERGGTRLFLIRNSWGEGWGLSGYAWLTADYLHPRLIRAAILTTEI